MAKVTAEVMGMGAMAVTEDMAHGGHVLPKKRALLTVIVKIVKALSDSGYGKGHGGYGKGFGQEVAGTEDMTKGNAENCGYGRYGNSHMEFMEKGFYGKRARSERAMIIFPAIFMGCFMVVSSTIRTGPPPTRSSRTVWFRQGSFPPKMVPRSPRSSTCVVMVAIVMADPIPGMGMGMAGYGHGGYGKGHGHGGYGKGHGHGGYGKGHGHGGYGKGHGGYGKGHGHGGYGKGQAEGYGHGDMAKVTVGVLGMGAMAVTEATDTEVMTRCILSFNVCLNYRGNS
ncbi:cuticle protein 64-like [Penaeus monodon]|uniref:cuticle protein 64-like n=1 Tax=Penaeus monodon TaxID=6687 RepID=UPI0018A6FEE4|nr:cuticle protein 64-like [Penaeus monodon]